MNDLYKIFVGIVFPVFLFGCANAISYHHSERNSIALEFRTTEPQQPLQGNVGVKTRTVLISPGMQDNDNNGKSLSVVSDFNFKRESDPDSNFGKTIIKSSFITGEAAKIVTKESVEALSGTSDGT